MFYTYIIWNETHQKYYVGYTHNLTARERQHNDPSNTFSKYTKKFSGKWTIIYSEEHDSQKIAMQRERELKSGKGREWIKCHILPGC